MMSCEATPADAGATQRAELCAEKRRLSVRQRELNASIGCARKDGEDATGLIAESRELSQRLKHIEEQLAVPEGEPEHEDARCPGVKVITETEEFAGLRDDWTQLISRSDVFSPFMMWEWLFSWWEYYGGNKKLRIFTVRDESGKLVGLAPLMIGFQGKRFEPRTLAFIGSGREGPRGQCFQVVVDPTAQDSASADLWAAIKQAGDEWDTWRMWKVMGDAATWDIVANAVQGPEHPALVEFESKAVRGRLHGSFERFLASVPGIRARRLLRNQYENLKGQVASMQYNVCRTQDELESIASSVMTFSIPRLSSLGNVSEWCQPTKRECLLRALYRLFEVDAARVPYILINGRIAAGAISLVRHDRLFMFAASFDVDAGYKNLMYALYGCFIREAIADGFAELDWLSDHSYVRRFVGGERSLLSIRICSSNSAGFERTARRVWMRSLRRRMNSYLDWLSRKSQ